MMVPYVLPRAAACVRSWRTCMLACTASCVHGWPRALQGYPGAPITPHYDSLLVKVTARAATFDAAVAKLTRALREHRIRGVSTNIAFLLNVLRHPAFVSGAVTTRFIEEYPEVLQAKRDVQNRGEKLLRFLSSLAVNGPEKSLGATGSAPLISSPTIPALPLPRTDPSKPANKPYLRDIYVKQGPKAFAAAVRKHEGLMVMDTTWRDAHQSLLATRVRTRDLLAIAPATRQALASAYALECWGGATFDVSMRFLHECPWDRLDAMREAVPDIPFQMLLRGANAVGYTSYPDNAVYKFCDVCWVPAFLASRAPHHACSDTHTECVPACSHHAMRLCRWPCATAWTCSAALTP